MKQLAWILWAKARMLRHTLASVRRHSRLKVAFVSLSAIGLWIGLFAAADLGFGLLDTLAGGGGSAPGLSRLLMARLLATFSMALLSMLILSNALVAYSTLYRSSEVAHWLGTPLPIRTLFLGRFWECLTFSSWASAYLGSPILVAYGLATAARPGFYLALPVFYLPFVVLPAAIGVTMTVLAVRTLTGLRQGAALGLAAAAVALLFVTFRALLHGTTTAPSALDLTTVIGLIERAGSPWSPGSWLAEGLLASAAGDGAGALFRWLLLAANAGLATWLAVVIAETTFEAGWDRLHGNRHRPARRRSRGHLLDLLGRLRPPWGPLVVKDLRLFWRDASQWSQFVLFFGLLALYVANLGRGGGAAGLSRSAVTLLHLAACLLILATLTTRFVYPLISLEGRRFWILGLAPLERRHLVRQKFFLSVATTLLFTAAVALLSGLRLRLDALELGASLATVLAASVGLSGLAVGLGSLFPDFRADGPSQAVSGMGGTLNFIISLAYVAAISIALGAVLLWRRLEPLTGSGARPWIVLAATGWVLACTLVAAWLPLRLGARNLERAEL